ncbi:MAG: DUF2269 family protein [Paracoccaceae bacterium]
MDWYLVAKFVHIAAAMAWVGGGFCFLLLGIKAARAGSRAEFLAGVGRLVQVAPVVFGPGSLVVLFSGLVMVWLGGWMWDVWVFVGLGGIVVTSGVGVLVLGPTAARILALSERPDTEDAAFVLAQRFLRVGKLDFVLHGVIVFCMVAKPGVQDTGMLIGLAIAVVLGVVMAQATGRRVAMA